MEENKTLSGEVFGQKVEGKTYKEFTLNYLTQIYEHFKDLEPYERLANYIDYFEKNFNYDNEQRNHILNNHPTETSEENEKSLYNLLTQGKGVCQQFAQALSLLSIIDFSKTKDEQSNQGIICRFAAPRLSVKGEEMGHAINAILGSNLIVDISSMIHARDGVYSQSKNAYCAATLSDYMRALKKDDIKIINDELGQPYMAVLVPKIDPSEYYDILNMPANELNSSHADLIKAIEIPNIDEEEKS